VRRFVVGIVLVVFGCKASRAEPVNGLCVTHGKLAKADDGRARVVEPAVRAVQPASLGNSASIAFTYRGPTDKEVALASGQIRKQIGLKLRAADGCNVVYVMWRFEPDPGIEVQIKRNPGKRTNKECGTRGYTKLAADGPRTSGNDRRVPVPRPEPGESHELAATIAGDRLEARVDGDLVWTGPLPADVAELDGPAGMRSDNVRADFALVAPGKPPAKRGSSPGCEPD
jgi:hypothetical protein